MKTFLVSKPYIKFRFRTKISSLLVSRDVLFLLLRLFLSASNTVLLTHRHLPWERETSALSISTYKKKIKMITDGMLNVNFFLTF